MITSRRYDGEPDYWRIRQFLIDTYPISPPGLNWEPRRWDGWFWHHRDTGPARSGPQSDVRIWQTVDDHLVGAVFAEDGGDAHPQVHPDHRVLEPDMIAWAEAHLACRTGPECRQLDIPAFDHDQYRVALLRHRGYQPTRGYVMRRMWLDACHRPRVQRVPGYRLRALRPHHPDDYQRVAELLNAAFARDWHTAAEFAALVDSPAFRFDLHLAAETGDGSFAAFVGVTIDEVNHRAIVEPVGTHPLHRRKGLATALLSEGLRRATALGATRAYLDTGTDLAANALYESVGFTDAYPGRVYRRRLYSSPNTGT